MSEFSLLTFEVTRIGDNDGPSGFKLVKRIRHDVGGGGLEIKNVDFLW